MTKKEIMKLAWSTHKGGTPRFQRSFSLCLKTAWEISKRPVYVYDAELSAKTISSMINAGI